MTRLTNLTRDSIANAAAAFGFDQKQEEIDKYEDTLAREAHAYVFDKNEIAAVNQLPECWVARLNKLKLNVAGERIDLRVSGHGLPVPHKFAYGYGVAGVIPPGDLCDRIQAHARNKEEVKRQRKSAQQKVRLMLDGVSSIKKLREVWPEGERFYSIYDAAPAPSAPAIRVEEINNVLGLPESVEGAPA